MFDPMTAPAHVLSIRFSGILTFEDVQKFQQALEDKLDKHEQVNACIDLTGLSDIEADALFGGIKADMEWLSHFDRVEQFALVSDKQWPFVVIGIITPMLLPSLEIKVFKSQHRKEALQWAATNATQIESGTSAF